MKRVIKFLPILVIFVAILALTGCNNTVNAPGKAWAKTEILEYTIKDGDKVVGTMTTVTERLSAGEYALSGNPEQKFTLKSSDGTRVTTKAVDTEGKLLMHSESLMEKFSPVASYKKIDNETTKSETFSYFDGTTVRYTKNGESHKFKLKKGSYTTNELLYTVLRCYNLSSYSATYQLVSPELDGKVSVGVSSGAVNDKFTFLTVGPDGETESKDVGAYVAHVALSEKPTGSAITLWYTDSNYFARGATSEGGLVSKQVPVKIVENNLSYTLTKVTVK